MIEVVVYLCICLYVFVCWRFVREVDQVIYRWMRHYYSMEGRE